MDTHNNKRISRQLYKWLNIGFATQKYLRSKQRPTHYTLLLRMLQKITSGSFGRRTNENPLSVLNKPFTLALAPSPIVPFRAHKMKLRSVFVHFLKASRPYTVIASHRGIFFTLPLADDVIYLLAVWLTHSPATHASPLFVTQSINCHQNCPSHECITQSTVCDDVQGGCK